jgi:hypothetical protein
VSDAHVPFHAVVNYDGQLTGQPGIHARFEAFLFERYRDQWIIAPKPIAPVRTPRDFIFDVVIAGTQLVPPILKSDLDAIGTREEYDDAYYAAFFKANRAVVERRVNCRCVGSGRKAGRAGEREGDAAATAAMRGPAEAGHYVRPGFDDPVTFCASASPFSLTFCSQRRAHAYSRPRMPRPIGITMMAGPGSAIMAMPTISTVNPTTEMAMRLASRYATLSMWVDGCGLGRFSHDATSEETAGTCSTRRITISAR